MDKIILFSSLYEQNKEERDFAHFPVSKCSLLAKVAITPCVSENKLTGGWKQRQGVHEWVECQEGDLCIAIVLDPSLLVL